MTKTTNLLSEVWVPPGGLILHVLPPFLSGRCVTARRSNFGCLTQRATVPFFFMPGVPGLSPADLKTLHRYGKAALLSPFGEGVTAVGTDLALQGLSRAIPGTSATSRISRGVLGSLSWANKLRATKKFSDYFWPHPTTPARPSIPQSIKNRPAFVRLPRPTSSMPFSSSYGFRGKSRRFRFRRRRFRRKYPQRYGRRY